MNGEEEPLWLDQYLYRELYEAVEYAEDKEKVDLDAYSELRDRLDAMPFDTWE